MADRFGDTFLFYELLDLADRAVAPGAVGVNLVALARPPAPRV